MKSLLQFFSSVKLAIVLLIIITIASIVGTLIPQNRSLAEYAARHGQFANLFNRLQLTSLYQSFWFIGLLILFSLNILVCTLMRISPKWKRAFQSKFIKERKKILVLKIKESFQKNWSLSKTTEELKKALSSRRYRLKEVSEENKTFFLARKRILGLFGSDIVHLGLLIILAGGIISGISGFKTNLNISEGQVLSIPKADFKLRLDKFETEYYPNGSDKDWKSTLTVIENNESRLSKTVEVNHPLSYKGFVFYQSGYGWNWESPSLEIWAKKREDPSFLKKIEIKIGERVKLEEENIKVSALHFVPDFVINEKNQVTTRSLQPNNPAAFIEGWREDEKIFSGWIFAKFPSVSRIHSEKETDLFFEFKDFRAEQYSSIQMSKDPGTNIIWVGCTFLMIGLGVAFYWPTREIKVILEESQGKTEVIAGGIATKSKDIFQEEFEKIMTSLRRTK
ncbi:MAG: cytochrome c biogenesis protein ResB [Candidatus Aminicenantes bacterium]|nr:MAG: cytochrome c biogenesis protein ResB [Candidatus Aminicenantes bacterium]